jgi:hypothetical protein
MSPPLSVSTNKPSKKPVWIRKQENIYMTPTQRLTFSVVLILPRAYCTSSSTSDSQLYRCSNEVFKAGHITFNSQSLWGCILGIGRSPQRWSLRTLGDPLQFLPQKHLTTNNCWKQCKYTRAWRCSLKRHLFTILRQGKEVSWINSCPLLTFSLSCYDPHYYVLPYSPPVVQPFCSHEFW